MRKTFAELLVLHTDEERGTDSEIKKRIHAVAKGPILYDVGTEVVPKKQTKGTKPADL